MHLLHQTARGVGIYRAPFSRPCGHVPQYMISGQKCPYLWLLHRLSYSPVLSSPSYKAPSKEGLGKLLFNVCQKCNSLAPEISGCFHDCRVAFWNHLYCICLGDLLVQCHNTFFTWLPGVSGYSIQILPHHSLLTSELSCTSFNLGLSHPYTCHLFLQHLFF